MAVISDSKFLVNTVHCCVGITIIVKGETRIIVLTFPFHLSMHINVFHWIAISKLLFKIIYIFHPLW